MRGYSASYPHFFTSILFTSRESTLFTLPEGIPLCWS